MARTLFALGELSHTHISYSGPEFHLDKITEELQEQAQVFREERIDYFRA